MKRRIGIVGCGVAGIQLAYSLKEHFELILFQYKTAEEIRKGKVLSTQVQFGRARDCSTQYGLPEYEEAPSLECIQVTIGDQQLFTGYLKKSATSVDQRLAYADAINDLKKQGVSIIQERIQPEQLPSLTATCDLIIDTTGKSGPLAPFPIEEGLTPYETPQRKCIVGYFKGVESRNQPGIGITILPGIGEMFEIPALTEHGPVTILFIEAVPEGALDQFTGMKEKNAFTERMIDVVRNYFPDIFSRIQKDVFALIDDLSYLQTAITPVVRRPYVMSEGGLIVGAGDSVFLSDPITGQGTNTASYTADQLASTLLDYKDEVWDETLGMEYWQRVKDYITAMTEWTNAMTGALPEHVIRLLIEGGQDQQIANQIAGWFENPLTAYEVFSLDPSRTQS